VVNKIVSEFMKLQGGRFSGGHLRHRCSLPTRATLVPAVATMSLAAGCGNTNAAPAIPTPEVELAKALPRMKSKQWNYLYASGYD
jgi:hypothetical protein